MLKRFARDLERCSLCGQCQPVCPVWRLTGEEADGPRGKMALALALANGALTPAEAANRFWRCVLCGRCSAACPAQVRVDGIILNVRSKLPSSLRLKPFIEKFFITMNNRPALLDRLQAPAAHSLALLGRLPSRIRARLPDFPPLALKPFRHAGRANQPGARVLLFPGCLSSRLMPKIAEAAALVLAAAGYEVIVPRDLVCCGRPMAVAGFYRAGLKACQRNLGILDKLEFDYIATPCPSCQQAITKIWPSLAGLEPKERALAANLAEKMANIAHLASRSTPARPGSAIFWHRSCLEDADAAEEARKPLGEAVIGAAAQCCGAPLALAGKKSMAGELAGSARSEILASGAKTVATACPGCVLALGRMFRAHGDSVDCRHYLEIYAATLSEQATGDSPGDKAEC